MSGERRTNGKKMSGSESDDKMIGRERFGADDAIAIAAAAATRVSFSSCAAVKGISFCK